MDLDNELLRGPVHRVVTTTQNNDGRTRRVETILDGEGRTLKMMVRYESGSERTYSADAGDASASQSTVVWLEDGGFVRVEDVQHVNAWVTPLGYHGGIGTKGAAVARTYFNGQSRPVVTVFENSEGEETFRLHYRFDDGTNTMEFVEAGGLVFEDADGSLRLNVSEDGTDRISKDAEGFRTTFRRDRQNLLIEQTTSFAGSPIWRSIYSRNELGEVTALKGLTFDLGTGESEESTAVFEYKYDERNNWVEKKCMTIDGTCLTTTHREIEYDEAPGQMLENSTDRTR